MNSYKISIKKIIKKWLVVSLLVILIRLIGITIRVRQLNKKFLINSLQKHGGVILATWHQNIFFSIWLLRNKDLTALISNSEDGEIIFKVFKNFGFSTVRGSTTRGGIPALKQLMRLLNIGKTVAITPDGPLGPPEKIQSGVVLLAKYANVPIIPWHYESKDQWTLNSWDNHKIPKPFTTVIESFGEPFYVPKNLLSEEVPLFCEKLEKKLNNLKSALKDSSLSEISENQEKNFKVKK